ncbi:hypothetical protein TIFTF001_034470 [Ficus carica]|uniref:Retrotransposon gag domain-containing protein n=1 Tax=Ficus carica TaxID=3494 RepID=A0AA88E095_FICCA|nr:hypothetical protein TIFTF001_034470 [Ficus carica]
MLRPHRMVPVNPPEPDLATVVANLQRQQETNRLREQLARVNPRPQVNEVPRVPPIVPPMPEVQPEIPRNVEVPLAPAEVQINPPLVREDLLYEQFRRMKMPEFEGSTDPIAADNWLIDIQVILDFIRLTEQEKDFVTEFRTIYYNGEILASQQDEFTNLKQGSMTVMEAVKKFEQLARLCPELVPSETEKVRRMMKMFRTDISKQVSAGSSPPTLVSDCLSKYSPDELRNQPQEARTITLPKVPSSLEGTKERGISRARDNKGITLRKGITEEMRVITLTSRCVRRVEENIQEYVEWGQTLATFVARRGIMQGVALGATISER